MNNNPTTPSHSVVPDPPGMSHVRKNYTDLHDLLSQLPKKLNKVSNNVDKEFLSAYRVHMVSIQAELKNLKQDVSKGEQLLNSDVTVAKLENEAKWFTDECTRLKTHFDAMTEDYVGLRDRLYAMNDQKVFLCDQLKALMKRNKVLEAEIQALQGNESLAELLSISTRKNDSIKGDFDDRSMEYSLDLSENRSPFGGQNNHNEMFLSPSGKEETYNYDQYPPNELDLTNNRYDELGPIEEELVEGKKDDYQESYHKPNTYEDYERSLSPKQLKQRLYSTDALLAVELTRASSPSGQRKHTKSMPNLSFLPPKKTTEILKEVQDKRVEISKYLETSVRGTFKDIRDRKLKNTKLSSTRKLPELHSTKKSNLSKSLDLNDDHRVKEDTLIKQYGGITGLGIHQFTDSDKFAAMVKFLANPTVFQQIINKLSEHQQMNISMLSSQENSYP